MSFHAATFFNCMEEVQGEATGLFGWLATGMCERYKGVYCGISDFPVKIGVN